MARTEPPSVPEGLLPLGRRCGDAWELELFRECGCGCLTCPHADPGETAAQASFEQYLRARRGPGTLEGLGLNRRLPDQLRAWLASPAGPRPRFVTLGYTTEPLPGLEQAEEVLDRSLRLLFAAGVGVSLQTRRLLPERILTTLGEHPDLARITLPLPTLADAELRIWEPATASVNQRLWNLQQLRRRRVPVTLSIKPLVPYVNDDEAHLGPLIRALADAGARRLTAEFLRLTATVRARLQTRSPVSTQLIFGAYLERELDERRDRNRPNLERRQAVLQRIAHLAAARRIRFTVCRCADPVLGRDPCLLWPGDTAAPTRQERTRAREQPRRAGAQVGFSDLLDSKQ